MATEKFSIIIDAKDETKRAIDSATRNFKQLQDLSQNGNGVVGAGRQTMIRDKSSERFSKDISVFKDSIKDFGNSIKGAFKAQPLIQQQKARDLKTGDQRQQIKGDFSKLISSMKQAVKEGVIEGIRNTGGVSGSGKRGGGSGSRRGGNFNLLGSIANALKGHLFAGIAVAVAAPIMKLSQSYQRNIMQQSQLSGVVRPNFLQTPEHIRQRFRGRNRQRVRQEVQNIRTRRQIDEYFNRRSGTQAPIQNQGADTGIRSTGRQLPGFTQYRMTQQDYDLATAEQRVGLTEDQLIGKASSYYINQLSKFGITAPDLQRMEFARLRAGGAMGGRITGVHRAGYIRGTGMDLAEGTAMMAGLARYGGRGRTGRPSVDIGEIAQYGAGAGFGGAMNPEFMRMVTQAVQEGTQAGFAGTPEDIAENMNVAMNLRDRRGRNVWDRQQLSRESGLSMMRSVQGVMQSTGRLQGGQQQEMMMAALMQHAQQQEGIRGRGAQLNWAMERLTNARYIPQVTQIMKNFTGRLEGRGTQAHKFAMMGALGLDWRQAGALQQADFTQKTILGRTPYSTLDERSQLNYRTSNKQYKIAMEPGGIGEISFKAVKTVQTALLSLGAGLQNLVKKVIALSKKMPEWNEQTTNPNSSNRNRGVQNQQGNSRQ